MTNNIDKIKFSMANDGILHIKCEPNTHMTIEEGKASTKMGLELIDGKPRPLLCDLTNVVKMTRDCRQYFAGPEHATIFSKCALIISSPISRIIGNFFLRANRPLKPTRLFTNKEEALNWLKNSDCG